GVQAGGGELVEQRLERVVGVPIDQRDVDIGAGQLAYRADATESPTDDDDVRTRTLRVCRGSSVVVSGRSTTTRRALIRAATAACRDGAAGSPPTRRRRPTGCRRARRSPPLPTPRRTRTARRDLHVCEERAPRRRAGRPPRGSP